MTDHDELPAWINAELSSELSLIRARGEGQSVEFKSGFPLQASDLAKEVAAFATSNSGTIYLGVSDEGDLVGLEGVTSVQGRDAMVQRLEGVCVGAVKPAVTPTVFWLHEDGVFVLAIRVPKGCEPVYYAQGKPYVRHLTSSRPAEPGEVVELVRSYVQSHPAAVQGRTVSPLDQFLVEIGPPLSQILAWLEIPLRERSIRPALDQWRSEWRAASERLHELSTHASVAGEDIPQKVSSLAKAVGEVSDFHLYIGCGDELEGLSRAAGEMAAELLALTVGASALDAQSVAQILELAENVQDRLDELSRRASELVDAGRCQELQDRVGLMGKQLTEVSFYRLDLVGKSFADRLREVGKEMWLIGFMRIHLDGGRSLARIVEAVGAVKDDLGRVLSQPSST